VKKSEIRTLNNILG